MGRRKSLANVFEKRQSALVAPGFTADFYGAEFQRSLPACFFGYHTGADLIGGLLGEVLFDFHEQAPLITASVQQAGNLFR